MVLVSSLKLNAQPQQTVQIQCFLSSVWTESVLRIERVVDEEKYAGLERFCVKITCAQLLAQ